MTGATVIIILEYGGCKCQDFGFSSIWGFGALIRLVAAELGLLTPLAAPLHCSEMSHV